MSKRFFLLGSVILAILFVMGWGRVAEAAEFEGGENVIIDADTVIEDDLFASGQFVEINGIVEGDLFMSGGQMELNGEVLGNVYAAGQVITINGVVDGSVLASGYALTLESEAEVGDNVYFGGYSLIMEREAFVDRNVYVGGYQAIIDGEIGNDLNVGASALEITGAVGGDVTGGVDAPGEADPVPPPQAFMPGVPAVRTISPGLQLDEAAEIGGAFEIVEATPEQAQPEPNNNNFIWDILGQLISLVIVGALLLYLRPSSLLRPADRAKDKPLPSVGYGFLVALVFFIGIPIAIALLIALTALVGYITIGQLGFATFGLGSVFLLLFIASFIFVMTTVTKVIVSLLIGHLLLGRFAPQLAEDNRWFNLQALALGALLYTLVVMVPILGGFASSLATLVGLGAIFLLWRDALSADKAAAVA